jgi:uncharacterized damage-inducible protein DinB
MGQTEREIVSKWWDEAWKDGLWAAAWSKSLEGLTPAQAAWTPREGGPGRHSIWQIVLHMIFWRESWLRRAATGQKPTDEELARGNFPEVTDPSVKAWEDLRKRFADTQARVGKALREMGLEADPMMYFLPHDCYHFGQINYLRAMQGLKAIE